MKKEKIITIVLPLALATTLIAIIVILLVSNSKYQVSDLTIKETGLTYIVGKFKNNSDKACEPRITVEVSSGSFSEEEFLTLDSVEPGENETIEELCFSCEGLTNAKIKVKEVKCN